MLERPSWSWLCVQLVGAPTPTKVTGSIPERGLCGRRLTDISLSLSSPSLPLPLSSSLPSLPSSLSSVSFFKRPSRAQEQNLGYYRKSKRSPRLSPEGWFPFSQSGLVPGPGLAPPWCCWLNAVMWPNSWAPGPRSQWPVAREWRDEKLIHMGKPPTEAAITVPIGSHC